MCKQTRHLQGLCWMIVEQWVGVEGATAAAKEK